MYSLRGGQTRNGSAAWLQAIAVDGFPLEFPSMLGPTQEDRLATIRAGLRDGSEINRQKFETEYLLFTAENIMKAQRIMASCDSNSREKHVADHFINRAFRFWVYPNTPAISGLASVAVALSGFDEEQVVNASRAIEFTAPRCGVDEVDNSAERERLATELSSCAESLRETTEQLAQLRAQFELVNAEREKYAMDLERSMEDSEKLHQTLRAAEASWHAKFEEVVAERRAENEKLRETVATQMAAVRSTQERQVESIQEEFARRVASVKAQCEQKIREFDERARDIVREKELRHGLLEKTVLAREKTITDLEGKLRASETTTIAMRQDLRSLQEQSSARLREIRDKAESQVARLGSQVQQINASAKMAEEARIRELEELRRVASDHRARLSEAEQELSVVRRQHASREAELAILANQHGGIADTAQAHKVRADQAHGELSSAISALRECEMEKMRIEGSRAETLEELERTARAAQASTAELQRLRAENAQLAERLGEYESVRLREEEKRRLAQSQMQSELGSYYAKRREAGL